MHHYSNHYQTLNISLAQSMIEREQLYVSFTNLNYLKKEPKEIGENI